MSKKIMNAEYAVFCIRVKVAGNESLIAQCKRLTKNKMLTKVFCDNVKKSNRQLELDV